MQIVNEILDLLGEQDCIPNCRENIYMYTLCKRYTDGKENILLQNTEIQIILSSGHKTTPPYKEMSSRGKDFFFFFSSTDFEFD